MHATLHGIKAAAAARSADERITNLSPSDKLIVSVCSRYVCVCVCVCVCVVCACVCAVCMRVRMKESQISLRAINQLCRYVLDMCVCVCARARACVCAFVFA